jgi:hypothetical protein
MKKLLSWSICVSILVVSILAQTPETFDIATFRPPAGWTKRTSKESLQFSTEDKAKGSYCLITLLTSVPGTSDARKNFDAAWQTVVKTVVNPTAAPQIFPSSNKEDWKAEGGFAPFEKDGEKGVAVLFTLSGYGKMVNILVLTNTMDHEPTITAFLESVNLKKPEPASQQPQTADIRTGSQPSVTQFFWKQSQNRKDIGGYAGYSRNTYQFNANGTYVFSRVDFQNYTPKYYLENEEGTYKITGNKITITPRKAIFSSHKSTKDDPPLKSGNLGLAAVQYSFEFMDLHNNGRWSLLLSPVDGIETKRDGVFSFLLNGEKRKTYSYSAVNANGELVP